MNKSKCRQDCELAEAVFAEMLNEFQKDIISPRMLMVGTAGNKLTHLNNMPGLDQPWLFSRYKLETLDFDSKWNPDIVGDITKPDKWILEPYDLIHITQVIEHIPNIFDLSKAFAYCLNPNGYVIVDNPWGPKGPDWHGEPPSFGDYWRISKDGMRVLFEKNFEIIQIIDTDANTSCLMKVKS